MRTASDSGAFNGRFDDGIWARYMVPTVGTNWLALEPERLKVGRATRYREVAGHE